MREIFKNRGHFCNYCRKIIFNKIHGTELTSLNINQVIWYAWDFPEHREEILKQIISINEGMTNKQFHMRQRVLLHKYGFTHQYKDFESKLDYYNVTGIRV
jgi:hypothetical protein